MLGMAKIQMKISSYMDWFVAQFRRGTRSSLYDQHGQQRKSVINYHFHSELYGGSEAVESGQEILMWPNMQPSHRTNMFKIF
jgi:hypothetical protein